MRTLRLLLVLLLLMPSLAFAQTMNSRTQDGLGNRIESATGTPGGGERGIIVRPIPSGTQSISASALPLPAGAATLEAVQNIEAAIREAQGIGGNSPFIVKGAGAVVAESLAVRCVNAGGTAFESCASANLPTGAATGIAQGSTTSGQVGTLIQGAVTTSPPAYGSGTVQPTSLQTDGSLRVVLTDIKAGGVSVMRTIGGSEALNTWNSRATDATNDHISVQGESASGATNSGRPVKIGGVFNTTQPTVSNGQTVDWQYSARGSAFVTPGVEGFGVSQVAAASGGATPYSTISTAAVLSAVIKASAGQVYGVQCFNLNAAPRFIRLYNQTGAPGSGDTANITWRGICPGNTAGSGFAIPIPVGSAHAAGIGIRASTGIADNDTGALAANELIFDVQYR